MDSQNKPGCRAVIDVGTGSVKLLVARVHERQVEPLLEQSEQTRLGAGFYPSLILQAGAIRRTAESVGRFSALARAAGAVEIRIIATSAAREASNQAELIAALQTASRAPVSVITGEEEADWVYSGVKTDPAMTGPLLVMDIGGGSTEFIFGREENPVCRYSSRLGAVRLLSETPLSDPPTTEEWLECQRSIQSLLASQVLPRLASSFQEIRPALPLFVSTGGTTTILACMELETDQFDRLQLEGVRLTRERVQFWRERMWTLSMADRRKTKGLPADRADIVHGGVAILAEAMRALDFPEVRVSTRGLRFAALIV